MRGARVDLGAALDERPRLGDVGDCPHQRGRTFVVMRVDVGAVVEQHRERCHVGIQRREHERRCAARPSSVQQFRIALETRASSGEVPGAQQLNDLGRGRIDWRRRDVAGRFIGPLRALIDPRLDDGDLFFRQRPGRRHLDAKCIADQPLIHAAAFAIAWPDHRKCAAAHRIAPPIEAEAVHLLRGTVAADAALPEDWLHIAHELDPCGR